MYPVRHTSELSTYASVSTKGVVEFNCSKLPWLGGNTRRHFPVREATKDKQVDGQIPHIPSISITFTQYARYVQIQHGITTWLYNSSILIIRLRGARYYKHGSHDPTFRAYKSKHMWKLNMSKYRHLQMKKAEKPDYLPNPGEGTRS